MPDPKISNRRKDQLVKLTDGIARVKKVKYIGKNEEDKRINTQKIVNPDKSTVTNRYEESELVASDYNPKKMKVKKTKKMKKTRVPRRLKKVKAPSYTSPEVTVTEEDLKVVADQKKKEKKRKKKKLLAKLPKIKFKKRKKVRKTRNLVTGKINKTRG